MVLVSVSNSSRQLTFNCRHTFIRQVLNIQDGDLDALLGEQLDNNLANAIAASGYNDNLAAPYIGIAAPVVGHAAVEPSVDGTQRTQAQQRLQAFERCGMVLGKGIALLRVARKEDEGKRERRVEGRVSDKAAYSITSYAYSQSQKSVLLETIAIVTVGGGNGLVLTFARKGPVASNRHRDGIHGGSVSERVVGIARGKPQLAADG